MRKIMRAFALLTYAATFIICAVAGFYYCALPGHYYLGENGRLKIPSAVPITAEREGEAVQVLAASGSKTVELRLLGIIPIKLVSVSAVDRPVLVPCGTPLGIKIVTDGVIVSDFGEVRTERGSASPAWECGIRKGDIITEINGEKILRNSEIAPAVAKNTADCTVKVKRGEQTLTFHLSPAKSVTDNIYKLGVWVRDSSAGIGTMTFYDSQTRSFAGLGHAVCDVDTGEILPIESGEVSAVTISGVRRGENGAPGELSGSFISHIAIGNIDINGKTGIFGEMRFAPTLSEGIPLGFKQEVETGRATILSTIAGMSPKEYEIEIESIDLRSGSDTKNMVVRITDPELLTATGGIVQGMSGSPIIQNGKLVGAITHVFVSDTTRGYAIFAETMHESMGR